MEKWPKMPENKDLTIIYIPTMQCDYVKTSTTSIAFLFQDDDQLPRKQRRRYFILETTDQQRIPPHVQKICFYAECFYAINCTTNLTIGCIYLLVL